jgi:uncharacterized protein
MITRYEIIDKLAKHREELRARGVKSLAVFGSFARGEATETSDIDLLVEFEPGTRIGLFGFVDVQDYLSELLGRRVDLVTREALHKRMKSRILQEAVYAE